MTILINAIGKLKSGPEYDLCVHYTKHLGWKTQFKEADIKKPLSSTERKHQEALELLKSIDESDHVIALHETGKEMTSQQFAAHLHKQQERGTRRIVFVIGGADGLHEAILTRANTTLSFGRVTWPHFLVRSLLCEQLYRAHTIIHNHPYHRA